MPYRILDRLDTQADRFAEINPDPLGDVTYRRGQAEIRIPAALGRSNVTEYSPNNGVVEVRYQDFILHASDLNFGAGETYPQPGDEIERANHDVYRLIPISIAQGQDQAPFEFITSSKKRVRVHTIQIHDSRQPKGWV